MKKIRMSIKNGKVSADFEGFYGTDCKTLEQRIKPESVHVDTVEDKPELNIEIKGNSQQDQDSESDYF